MRGGFRSVARSEILGTLGAMRTLLTTLFAAATLSGAFGQGIEFEYNWSTALQRAKAEHKPMLIDFYTDWCGWCKVQDTTTWLDADVARYVNTYMVAVKLDAEREKIRLEEEARAAAKLKAETDRLAAEAESERLAKAIEAARTPPEAGQKPASEAVRPDGAAAVDAVASSTVV